MPSLELCIDRSRRASRLLGEASPSYVDECRSKTSSRVPAFEVESRTSLSIHFVIPINEKMVDLMHIIHVLQPFSIQMVDPLLLSTIDLSEICQELSPVNNMKM